jgi:hypothetical protein
MIALRLAKYHQITRNVMLITFLNSLGVVHFKSVHQDKQWISFFIFEFWKNTVMPLRKITGISKKLDTTPLYALYHTSLAVWQFLVYNQIPATTFSTSPSTDFLALSKPQNWAQKPLFCICWWNSVIILYTHTEYKRCDSKPHSHNKRALPRCFQQWQDHWSKCEGAEKQ